MAEQQRNSPHPFAWILAAGFVLALIAAALAPDRAPAVALYWNPIYRAEIAVVVLVLVYLLAIAGWMAWNGQAFRRIELPGGAALERDTADLDAAAGSLVEFQSSASDRLYEIESSLDDVIDRVGRLERPGSSSP